MTPTPPQAGERAEALLPCPFCGGEPMFESIEAHTHHIAVFMPDYPGACIVSCEQCCVAIMCEGEASKDDVYARWNARTALPAIAALDSEESK